MRKSRFVSVVALAIISVFFLTAIGPAINVKSWTDTIPSFEFGAYVLGDTMKIQSDGAHGVVYTWDAFTLQDPAGILKINHHIVAPELFTYTLLPTDLQGIWTACQKWWEYDDNGKKVWAFTVGTTIVTSPSGNKPPTAMIESISPRIALPGQLVSFSGYGTDPEGDGIIGYNWRSDLSGQLNTSASFSTSSLSIGYQNIYFRVEDEHGLWSAETSWNMEVLGNRAPNAYIISIYPNAAAQLQTVRFSGSADDPDGDAVTGYNWRSVRQSDGAGRQLSTQVSFSTYFTNPDVYNIYFKAMDEHGLWSVEKRLDLWIYAGTTTDSDGDGVTNDQDLNPVANLEVWVQITRIQQITRPDSNSDGDWYWEVEITDRNQYLPPKQFLSSADYLLYENKKEVNITSEWFAKFDVPDNIYRYFITIRLYDRDGSTNQQCDIGPRVDDKSAIIEYDLRTGDWTYDDRVLPLYGDSNGIGHVSGVAVGDTQTPDAELWFYVWQNDNDGDGLTFWEEANTYLTDALECDYSDVDNDGLANDLEYDKKCKSDSVDSDGDGMWDSYENNCDGLSPIRQYDSIFVYKWLYNHFYFESSAFREYSEYLSYEWYKSLPLYSSEVQVDSFLENSAFARNEGDYDTKLIALTTMLKIAEGAVTTWYFPEAWPAIALATVAEIWTDYMLDRFATACWGAWDKAWATWLPGDPDQYDPSIQVLNAGWISQVGYGFYGRSGGINLAGGEELKSILSGLSSRYQLIMSLMGPGSTAFTTGALPEISNAYSLFGDIYDAQETYADAPIEYDGQGTIGGKVVIDKYNENFRHYSRAEYLIYRFAKNVESRLPSQTVLGSIHNDKITVGEVASDLVNLAYDTFMWLKRERLLLETLLHPVAV